MGEFWFAALATTQRNCISVPVKKKRTGSTVYYKA